MSIVVGLNDPGYCETKAIELITEAKIAADDLGEYHEKISQAMSLLALAKVQRNGSVQAAKQKRS